jgi:hypothetical protein
MPDRLRRERVTLAQRVMIPTTILVNLAFGTALVREPLTVLLGVPAYRTLDGIVDIRAWGWLFIGAGLAQVCALLTRGRYAYIYSLGVCLIAGAVLTGCLIYGATQNTNPWTAPWFPLYFTLGCLASARSLEARER